MLFLIRCFRGVLCAPLQPRCVIEALEVADVLCCIKPLNKRPSLLNRDVSEVPSKLPAGEKDLM